MKIEIVKTSTSNLKENRLHTYIGHNKSHFIYHQKRTIKELTTEINVKINKMFQKGLEGNVEIIFPNTYTIDIDNADVCNALYEPFSEDEIREFYKYFKK